MKVVRHCAFGYVEVEAVDPIAKKVLFAYCEGRSASWRVCFGWRKTEYNKATFLLPYRAYQELLDIYEYKN